MPTLCPDQLCGHDPVHEFGQAGCSPCPTLLRILALCTFKGICLTRRRWNTQEYPTPWSREDLSGVSFNALWVVRSNRFASIGGEDQAGAPEPPEPVPAGRFWTGMHTCQAPLLNQLSYLRQNQSSGNYWREQSHYKLLTDCFKGYGSCKCKYPQPRFCYTRALRVCETGTTTRFVNLNCKVSKQWNILKLISIQMCRIVGIIDIFSCSIGPHFIVSWELNSFK